MGGAQDQDSRGGVIGRVRDVADGLGQLVGQHFKLARLELVSDLKSMGQRVRAVAILTVLAIIGYTLAMAGVAVVVGGNQAIGLPLLLIGGGHVLVGVAGILFTTRRRASQLLDTSVEQMGQSLNSLRHATEPELPATSTPRPQLKPPATPPLDGHVRGQVQERVDVR